ncbi:MAG: sulfatase-like hydrolase/transferase [Planctomycetaceae bacterium]|nr:sulfatase-like hydrolase/transferase [Planctomycetaceae bacterium]
MSLQPNILFILSDQHNAKYLGAAGHPHVLTPNLDRMAARGVRFDAAVAQNTICTPSRVCQLSGQYCHNHGYYALLGPRPAGLPTVLGHFRKAGYHTAFVGKSHGPEYWIEDDCDEFHDTTDCAIGGRSKEFLTYLKGRGVDITADFKPDADNAPSVIEYQDSEEGWGSRKTIDIMKRAAEAGKPFFMAFWPPKPHGPYTPAKRFWDLYDRSKLALPPNANYDLAAAGKSPLMQSVTNWVRDKSPDFEGQRWNKLQAYMGNVSQIDQCVGDVLAFLDESGLAENTIVVYCADHGDYGCEHGPNEKVPGICTDAVTRVPMIWQWPGHLKSGHLATDVVETVDIVPTLCSLAGVEPLQTADGRDISAMLAGIPGDPHRLGVTEYPLSKSVRKGQWRLVYYPHGFFADTKMQVLHPENNAPDARALEGLSSDRTFAFGELYDLKNDPWEMKNLYFDPAYQHVVQQLQRELMDWLMYTTRPVTMQSPTDIAGDQVTRRYTLPINPDGKLPYQQFRLGLGGPHL